MHGYISFCTQTFVYAVPLTDTSRQFGHIGTFYIPWKKD